MTPDQLTERLGRVRDAGYAAPNDYWHLTESMLQAGLIGHPDPRLRDDLIYSTLARWITAGAYSDDQLRHILTVAVDDRLAKAMTAGLRRPELSREERADWLAGF